jgi:hypothetical protein
MASLGRFKINDVIIYMDNSLTRHLFPAKGLGRPFCSIFHGFHINTQFPTFSADTCAHTRARGGHSDLMPTSKTPGRFPALPRIAREPALCKFPSPSEVGVGRQPVSAPPILTYCGRGSPVLTSATLSGRGLRAARMGAALFLHRRGPLIQNPMVFEKALWFWQSLMQYSRL